MYFLPTLLPPAEEPSALDNVYFRTGKPYSNAKFAQIKCKKIFSNFVVMNNILQLKFFQVLKDVLKRMHFCIII
jgi:hypothetical protein